MLRRLGVSSQRDSREAGVAVDSWAIFILWFPQVVENTRLATAWRHNCGAGAVKFAFQIPSSRHNLELEQYLTNLQRCLSQSPYLLVFPPAPRSAGLAMSFLVRPVILATNNWMRFTPAFMIQTNIKQGIDAPALRQVTGYMVKKIYHILHYIWALLGPI